MNEHAFCSLHPVLQEGSLENRLATLNPAWCWQPASENAQSLGSLLKDDKFAQQAVLAFQKAHQAPTAKVAASLVHNNGLLICCLHWWPFIFYQADPLAPGNSLAMTYRKAA